MLVQGDTGTGKTMIVRITRTNTVSNPADGTDNWYSTKAIPAGQWVNFEVNYPNRIGPGYTGQFQVWQDGVLILDISSANGQRGVEGPSLVTLWQLQTYGGKNYGNFVNNPPFLMYTDDIKISASRIADH